MLSDPLIDQILSALPGKRIGLVGDLFLDRYLDIDADLTEPSVETGLDAYQVMHVRSYPGALGTVINNLAALGVGKILPISFYGDDGEGYELQQALDRMPAIEKGGLYVTPQRRTPTYMKPMVGLGWDEPRELNRFDIKNRTPTPPLTEENILKLVKIHWNRVDAWIVLDQVSESDCGVITRRVRDRIADLAAGTPDKFVLADSRENIFHFRNVCVKPNQREAAAYPGGAAAFARENGRPVRPDRRANARSGLPGDQADRHRRRRRQHQRRNRLCNHGRGDLRTGRGVRQSGGLNHDPADRHDRDREPRTGP
jgi:bifunctional ADP-heptose synthase (sugar kinase/adenylyltransferase)